MAAYISYPVERLGVEPFQQSIVVTNGMKKVSATVTRDDRPRRVEYLTLPPEKAIELGIALLNAAANVQDQIHGNTDGAQYTSKRIAKSVIGRDEEVFGEKKA